MRLAQVGSKEICSFQCRLIELGFYELGEGQIAFRKIATQNLSVIERRFVGTHIVRVCPRRSCLYTPCSMGGLAVYSRQAREVTR